MQEYALGCTFLLLEPPETLCHLFFKVANPDHRLLTEFG